MDATDPLISQIARELRGVDPAAYFVSGRIVRRVIYAHINQIRHCYQQSLSKQPTLAGRLVVIFEISPKGHVDDLLISESALGVPALHQCIGDTMRTWEFPAAPFYSGNVRIVYREGGLGPVRPRWHLWRVARHLTWLAVDSCRLHRITKATLPQIVDTREFSAMRRADSSNAQMPPRL